MRRYRIEGKDLHDPFTLCKFIRAKSPTQAQEIALSIWGGFIIRAVIDEGPVL